MRKPRGSDFAKVGEEHAKRWPGIRASGFVIGPAVYGNGVEPVRMTLTWIGLPSCDIEVTVSPDRRVPKLTIVDKQYALKNVGTADLPPSRQLQRIPYGMLRDAAADYLRRVMEIIDSESYSKDLTDASRTMTQAWTTAFSSRPRPGRAGRDDQFYAELAAAYVDACAAAPRRGLVELSKRLAQRREHMSAKQLAALVSEARRRGLLTRPARKGVQGGDLTPRARELLQGGN